MDAATTVECSFVVFTQLQRSIVMQYNQPKTRATQDISDAKSSGLEKQREGRVAPTSEKIKR